jgi:hypothetical protein
MRLSRVTALGPSSPPSDKVIKEMADHSKALIDYLTLVVAEDTFYDSSAGIFKVLNALLVIEKTNLLRFLKDLYPSRARKSIIKGIKLSIWLEDEKLDVEEKVKKLAKHKLNPILKQVRAKENWYLLL